MTEILHKSAVASVMSTTGRYGDASPNGSFSVLLSTPDLDRDGERLLTSEWELPLPSRCNFDVDHAMSVERTVGSGVPFLNRDGDLQVDGEFASTALAQLTRTLVNEGHIDRVSVTYLQKSVQIGGKNVTRRQLLNGAFVSIPANPAARVLASKRHGGHGPSEFEVRSALADARRLVADHQDPATKALAHVQRVMVRAIARDARRL